MDQETWATLFAALPVGAFALAAWCHGWMAERGKRRDRQPPAIET